MKAIQLSHYSKWPHHLIDWKARWPNISLANEAACSLTGEIMADFAVLDGFQAVRYHLNRPVIFNSIYRSQKLNVTLPGSSESSYHRGGRAGDPSLVGHDRDALEHALRTVGGFTCVVHYSTFLHADVGPDRTWPTDYQP